MTTGAIITVPLRFRFKGSRDYVHGTDMYDAVVGHLSTAFPGQAKGAFKMVIHHVAHHQCRMLYSVGNEPIAAPANGRVEFSLSNHIYGWLAETDEPVEDRRAYPENDIVAGSRVDGQTICGARGVRSRPIELLVALTKRLHEVLRGKHTAWAFTRLELLRPLIDSDRDALRIELLQSLGNRLTKSAVHIPGTRLGYIYFSIRSA